MDGKKKKKKKLKKGASSNKLLTKQPSRVASNWGGGQTAWAASSGNAEDVLADVEAAKEAAKQAAKERAAAQQTAHENEKIAFEKARKTRQLEEMRSKAKTAWDAPMVPAASDDAAAAPDAPAPAPAPAAAPAVADHSDLDWGSPTKKRHRKHARGQTSKSKHGEALVGRARKEKKRKDEPDEPDSGGGSGGGASPMSDRRRRKERRHAKERAAAAQMYGSDENDQFVHMAMFAAGRLASKAKEARQVVDETQARLQMERNPAPTPKTGMAALLSPKKKDKAQKRAEKAEKAEKAAKKKLKKDGTGSFAGALALNEQGERSAINIITVHHNPEDEIARLRGKGRGLDPAKLAKLLGILVVMVGAIAGVVAMVLHGYLGGWAARDALDGAVTANAFDVEKLNWATRFRGCDARDAYEAPPFAKNAIEEDGWSVKHYFRAYDNYIVYDMESAFLFSPWEGQLVFVSQDMAKGDVAWIREKESGCIYKVENFRMHTTGEFARKQWDQLKAGDEIGQFIRPDGFEVAVSVFCGLSWPWYQARYYDFFKTFSDEVAAAWVTKLLARPNEEGEEVEEVVVDGNATDAVRLRGSVSKREWAALGGAANCTAVGKRIDNDYICFGCSVVLNMDKTGEFHDCSHVNDHICPPLSVQCAGDRTHYSDGKGGRSYACANAPADALLSRRR